MFAGEDRSPQDPAVSDRPGTLAAPARTYGSLRQDSQMPPCPRPEARLLAEAGPTANNFGRMNTYAKSAANPFGMRTSKSLDLKSRAMNTYKKRGRGVGVICYPPVRAVLAAHANNWPTLNANGPTFQNVTEGVQ
jgi:hypothetical protein